MGSKPYTLDHRQDPYAWILIGPEGASEFASMSDILEWMSRHNLELDEVAHFTEAASDAAVGEYDA